jgi:hypothetical protein
LTTRQFTQFAVLSDIGIETNVYENSNISLFVLFIGSS